MWLDLPLVTKLARLLRRSWRRVRTREPLWNGNVERWRDVFVGRDSVIIHTLRAHRRDRRALPHPQHAHKTLRLRTPAEIERWLVAYFAGAGAAAAGRANCASSTGTLCLID